VAGYILDKNKSAVIIVNKWDAIDKDENTMKAYAQQVREQLKFMAYVPVLFISAKTRQRVHQVLPTALEVFEARQHRLTTSEFNQVLHAAYDSNLPPSHAGRYLRIYYGTQVGNDPPTFVIFVNDPDLVHFSYERYLQNRIREHFPFTGTPIRLLFRGRDSDS
jgi:GTP-binding protein